MDTKDNKLDKFLWESHKGLRLQLPKKLYHYTGSKAVASIKNNLKCFNASAMEDPIEFRLGRCFLEQMKVQNDFPLNEVLSNPTEELVRCWTFSLCREGANIEMGRKYACSKEGYPVVLEFEYEPLAESVSVLMEDDLGKETSSPNPCELHFLLPCIYSISHYSMIKKLQRFLFGEYYKWLCNKLRSMNNLQIACACSYMFRAMIKCDVYKKEQEYRLVKITFDGSNEKCVPYGFSGIEFKSRKFCCCDGQA